MKINKIDQLDQLQTAMLGAMIGDALGVPHEFKEPHALNEQFIDHPMAMHSPEGSLYKTYDVPLGIYSDDFSQQLCVYENYKDGAIQAHEFYDDMLMWQKGRYWVNGKLFDEGTQTHSQLKAYERSGEIRIHDDHMAGNGSLMRVLPLAFLTHDLAQMKVLVFQCSAVTHNSEDTIKACQFYTLLARLIIEDCDYGDIEEFDEVWKKCIDLTEWNPERSTNDFGSGYVIDTLNIVKDCIEASTSYNEAVKRAVMYGGDTDTNACVVGGIAALVFGLQDLNPEWLEFVQPCFENKYVNQLFNPENDAT
jgi:ADP-ribosyl-[dinitrogen reductase] hydrolase